MPTPNDLPNAENQRAKAAAEKDRNQANIGKEANMKQNIIHKGRQQDR